MAWTRIYLPHDLDGLVALQRTGEVAASGEHLDAWAVTVELERATPDADEEELEFLAMHQALASLPTGRGRRAVVAADIERPALTKREPEPGSAHILVRPPVPRRRIASVHVEETPPTGSDEVPDLLWFDVTELAAAIDYARG